MARDEFVFDDRRFRKRMALYNRRVFGSVSKAMRENGDDLLRKSIELAPVDEGTLIRSGSRELRGKDLGSIEVLVGFNTPYAANLHETMIPAPGGTKRPGPRTSQKLGNEFGRAGGWYLRRPLVGRVERYARRVARILRTVH